MTIPKHTQEEIRASRRAIAPYNFVPLPDSVRLAEKPPSQGLYDESLLTGTVICTLVNETPIYVRAAQTLKQYADGETSQEPFYYGEKLIIPGSSLRGMLRTLVEVVSQARLAPVTEKQLFYRSVEDTSMGQTYRDRMKDKVRAGFYHENQSGSWITPTIACRILREDILSIFGGNSLYKNERPASPKRVPRSELQHKSVYAKLSEKSLENPARFYDAEELARHKQDGLQEGVLVITGDMQNKKNEFVFMKMAVGDSLSLKDAQIYLFEDRDQVTQYQKNAFANGKRDPGTLHDGDPVFYLVGENENEIVGFGRAYMFRLPYKLSPVQMLPDELAGDESRYDLAEAMFGYVPSEKVKKTSRQAVAGRVFIGDAVMTGKVSDAMLPAGRLKILSSPKPTSFQHYLTQDRPDDPNRLYHYDSPKDKTTLRGHKFYWHKGMVQPEEYLANEQDTHDHETQYAPPVKPIKPQQAFAFEIRFENLKPEELGALLWVLDKARDEQYRLKIGMGKPYGLGSVRIDSSVEIDNRQARYEQLFEKANWFDAKAPDGKEKCNLARLAFARWVLRNENATTDDVDLQKRIQELLIMLSWKEHPAKDETRYMTLKEFVGKEGRFNKKRPVLASPHTVFGKWLKTPAPKVYTPTTVAPSQLQPGDIIQAVSLGRDGEDYVLSCEHHGEDDLCYVRKDKVKRPADYILDVEGSEVLLEVLSVKAESDYWIIDCQTVNP